ncbi:MFS quinate transporter [Aspergillus heteromorphus CBS 117.55]|uniref:MFS quinate transporter n=1 Tax=Aspergillus heteromorphus CBS 117.55 TaxID=1448321 RepID=A0A317V4U0_9EURO|nr:MFS quinate transporter [Aspergillus heteromorphus CBS 117.55]PWY67210.1 MFS quinate transporter [Aspergillus heteromorphus CBS 117.55]
MRSYTEIAQDSEHPPPPAPHGVFRLYWLTAIVCCGGLLFGYDSGVIGGVLTFDSFHRSFQYTAADETRVSSIAVGIQQASALLGSLLIWPLTNRYGRRPAMALCSLIFCTGVLFELVDSRSLSVFYVGRVICGLGIGGSATVIPIYLSEMSPTDKRGRLGSCYQFTFTIGIFLSYWIDYGMQFAPANALQWQIPLAVQLIPGALMGLGMLTLRESVRWLLSHDRESQAWDSLTWIRSSHGPDVRAEFQQMKSSLESDAHAAADFSAKELLTPSNRHRLALGVSLFICQQSTGATAMAYFGPQFFSLLVGDNPHLTLLLTGIFGALKVISCLTFIVWVADRFGRRPLLILGALAMSVCMISTSAVVKSTTPTTNTTNTTGTISHNGLITVSLIYLAIASYNLSWGPLPWPCTAELFNSRIREPGVAIGVAAQWLSNFVWSFSTPYVLAGAKWATFLIFGILDAVFALFVWMVLPETRGRSLEEIDMLGEGGEDEVGAALLVGEGEGDDDGDEDDDTGKTSEER